MYRPIYLDNPEQRNDGVSVFYGDYQVTKKGTQFSWKRGEPP